MEITDVPQYYLALQCSSYYSSSQSPQKTNLSLLRTIFFAIVGLVYYYETSPCTVLLSNCSIGSEIKDYFCTCHFCSSQFIFKSIYYAVVFIITHNQRDVLLLFVTNSPRWLHCIPRTHNSILTVDKVTM